MRGRKMQNKIRSPSKEQIYVKERRNRMKRVKTLKYLFHKLGISILTLMMAFGFLDLKAIKAATASVTVKNAINYSYNVTTVDGYSAWGAYFQHIYADGEIAFCVQPEVVVQTGASYTTSNYTNISASQRRTLEHIAYVGWELSDKTDEDYVATQLMIWELFLNLCKLH